MTTSQRERLKVLERVVYSPPPTAGLEVIRRRAH
jgi:hypothetical protein